ncbi:MAG: glycosyltransferase [Nanoarchaeota archaeon]
MELIQIVIYVSIYIGLVATTFYILSFIKGREKTPLLFKDNELPKVSVIIPAYNEENTIEKTIKSILASDYPKEKLEVIIIDDGSKDNTFKTARKYESSFVRVYSQKNQGKGAALNFGLKKCHGEIFFSMDADTRVDSNSLKSMVRYFKDEKIMSVTPSMLIETPKNILQRIQYTEYILGLFLRKTFAFLNAIHITPGAFSAYRMSFIKEYGGYDVGNVTEDLELALRIQFNGYRIENDSNALVYTIAPSKFSHLLKQRRRWYVGLINNLWNYRKMINPKYGDMGMFVIPIALISIFFSVFVTFYLFIKTLLDVKKQILFLNSINFDLENTFKLNLHVVEKALFLLLTNPIIIFILLFVVVIGGYIFYASKKVGKMPGLVITLPLFILCFAILFGFWWLVSLPYILLNKKVSWK